MKIKKSFVCKNCMEAIESHNGKQRHYQMLDDIPEELIHVGYYDEDGEYQEDEDWEDGRSEECMECEFCKEMTLLDDIVIWI